MYLDCHKPENRTPARAIREALEAINAVHRAFGAPGNYGYGTPKGDALRWAYDATFLLLPVLKVLDPDEAKQAATNIAAARSEEDDRCHR